MVIESILQLLIGGVLERGGGGRERGRGRGEREPEEGERKE